MHPLEEATLKRVRSMGLGFGPVAQSSNDDDNEIQDSEDEEED